MKVPLPRAGGLRKRPSPELVANVAALERTALAWERTAISLAVLGTVVFKFPQGGSLVRAGGLLLLATAVVVVGLLVPLGYRRARDQLLTGGPEIRLHGRDAVARGVLFSTAAVVSLVAAAGIIEALLVLGAMS